MQIIKRGPRFLAKIRLLHSLFLKLATGGKKLPFVRRWRTLAVALSRTEILPSAFGKMECGVFRGGPIPNR